MEWLRTEPCQQAGWLPCACFAVSSKMDELYHQALHASGFCAERSPMVTHLSQPTPSCMLLGPTPVAIPPGRAEIAAAVTSANPRPVTLKMEKVYQPCILQTKKRYVGFAYEAADQAEPVFDAKGIETIRCGCGGGWTAGCVATP